jgi:hypothetical protein
MGQDIYKIGLQNNILLEYLKSQEAKAKETKDA